MTVLRTNTNPVVLRSGVGIGTGNAESDDEFLFDCFVEHPAVDVCRRTNSPGMVVSGRTGSGKTAILRFIENGAEYVTSIDPFEMSMSYVSNSDALRFLNAIGADTDLLFQVLWKHVLCIEFIRLRWDIRSTEKSRTIFSRIVEKFNGDDRRKKAIEYLRAWQGKFWITMDENIKELTVQIEDKLNELYGGEIGKFKAGGQYDKRLSLEKKSEIIARSRAIISSDQLAELHGVIDLLSSADRGDSMKNFYIMLDRLDEKWVDDAVRFRMIKGLLESLKGFRKIQNLKILVALRTDVIERVVQETADISFQREKFEDMMIKIRWSKQDLKDLVDKRIGSLFRRQYTQASVAFEDVFPSSMGQRSTFDWMIERTLMRPRDIIAFINEAIDISAGSNAVSVSNLRKAEVEFARKRKDALVQEWASAYHFLDDMLKLVTSKRKSGIDVVDLIDKVDDFCLEVCSKPKVKFDPIYIICEKYINSGKSAPVEILAEVLAHLYRTGAVGIKIDAQDKFIYSHIDQPLISPDLINVMSKVRLHPMLLAAYNLQER